ncbi:YceD family protein [Desmospora activa]|uniref:Metal-binding protein n=1 Tax=Desmospora activa DSM 45169 TaxID=1121389 RepID=A0A2T4ZB37_9BACL|nr:DUF177 domain-containing protein [Desmospora activa]PTM59108.1 uncharacterized protein C8J48_1710 [Desmospora activa DSM 45169]
MRMIFRELNRRTGPVELEGEVTLQGLEKENPDLLSLDPLQVNILAWKEKGLYQVQGKQHTRVKLNCSRCLTPFSQPLEMEWFQAFTDDEQQMEAWEEEGEDVRLVQPDQPTDLTPFIREALLLELPLAPVCQPDCLGLCSVCGSNRNRESCDCDRERVDPRMAKLQEFFKNQD